MTNFVSASDIAGIKYTAEGYKVWSCDFGFYPTAYGTFKDAERAAYAKGYKEVMTLKPDPYNEPDPDLGDIPPCSGFYLV